MKTKKTKSLPNKPSKLIRVALADLDKCERSKRYKIDMEYWHQPNGACKVCLAGAVIAKTLGIEPEYRIDPWDIAENGNEDTKNKLLALNSFRLGEIDEALSSIGHDNVTRIRRFKVSAYRGKNKPQFKRDMRKLATLLAKNGL